MVLEVSWMAIWTLLLGFDKFMVTALGFVREVALTCGLHLYNCIPIIAHLDLHAFPTIEYLHYTDE